MCVWHLHVSVCVYVYTYVCACRFEVVYFLNNVIMYVCLQLLFFVAVNIIK